MHGLEPDRFALINKTHHCLVDGVSGVDITTVLFDLDRNPDAVDGAPDAVDAGARAVGRGHRGPGGGRPRGHAVPPGP